jgi:divalent metal cation (Fe/Co/Zn/Cd) transporter
LIQNYRYIDDLLDSSLPHDLIQEYNTQVAQSKGYGATHYREEPDVPDTISEEDDEEAHPRLYTERHGSFDSIMANGEFWANGDPPPPMNKVKRTPKDIYRVKKDDAGSDERQPLLQDNENNNTRFGTTSDNDVESGSSQMPPDLEIEDEADSNSPIVTRAIYINTAANLILLILKLIVVLMSSSVSVLASLVDAALDFLSTAIVGVTTWMIMRTDQYAYPIGRRRLEPVGVLVFSVIMITAFLQVFWQALTKLSSGDNEVVELTPSAIGIMASTVVVKGLCWLYCRLIRNSSVQALAQDAMTDVVFNTFSIIFPLGTSLPPPSPSPLHPLTITKVGFALGLSFLDPLGGVILSLYVIINWSHTANEHICNLAGQAATADQRNILLYLTMRFAKTIKHIQGLQAYHVGDKLNVEVDIVLDERTSLRDSHDLGESLQYVLESVPEGKSNFNFLVFRFFILFWI